MVNKKIVVFGSFVTDLTSHSPHLPVPGETLKGVRFKNGPGGKGSSQAVAAHRAGADFLLITKLGDDVFGKMAKALPKKQINQKQERLLQKISGFCF